MKLRTKVKILHRIKRELIAFKRHGKRGISIPDNMKGWLVFPAIEAVDIAVRMARKRKANKQKEQRETPHPTH